PSRLTTEHQRTQGALLNDVEGLALDFLRGRGARRIAAGDLDATDLVIVRSVGDATGGDPRCDQLRRSDQGLIVVERLGQRRAELGQETLLLEAPIRLALQEHALADVPEYDGENVLRPKL